MQCPNSCYSFCIVLAGFRGSGGITFEKPGVVLYRWTRSAYNQQVGLPPNPFQTDRRFELALAARRVLMSLEEGSAPPELLQADDVMHTPAVGDTVSRRPMEGTD